MSIRQSIKLFFCFIMINSLHLSVSKAQQNKSLQELTEITQRLKKAMIDADSLTLTQLVSDSLSYGHSGGMVQNKEQFINSITSKSSVFLTIDLTNQKISVLGNTGIIRHILSAATNDAGKGPGTVKLAILEVWVKDKREWKLFARQAVKAN